MSDKKQKKGFPKSVAGGCISAGNGERDPEKEKKIKEILDTVSKKKKNVSKK